MISKARSGFSTTDLAAGLLLCLAGVAGGREMDLAELSIEELMNIEVTSPSRKEQAMFAAPAAISVLTGEDLRRAGVTTIPAALRLVPGVQVGRADANKWAVSARGFNDFFANKLLVLIDGRSVYSPMFSGVFWESQDVVMGDVERIEVIRGPGGTLWGANAVNGVINIITRDARDTQGGLVRAGSGSAEEAFGTARFGGQLDETAYYRVYAKYFRRSGSEDIEGRELADDWHVARAGTRLDWELSDRDALTLQGEIYDGEAGQTYRLATSLLPPYVETFANKAGISGGHLLGRWEHALGGGAELELQVYYDLARRLGNPVGGETRTLDFDLQHRCPLSGSQEIVWGTGGRFVRDDSDSSFAVSLNPLSRSTHLVSAFVQDELALFDGRLLLTAGSKLEHNTYTGLELQPNVRLAWTPNPQHTLWGAISRAVRTPSRGDSDERFNAEVISADQIFPGSPLTLATILGNKDCESEYLLAFDVGYRTQLGEGLGLDLAAFANLYDNLFTSEPKTPYMEETLSPPHLLIPIVRENKLHGVTRGAEAAISWQARERWRLHAAYTYLHMNMELDAGSLDPLATTWDEENPNHQLVVRSAWDATERLALDIGLRYVDELPILKTDAYVAMDARLSVQPTDRLEIFLVGQHLLAGAHLEFPRQVVVFVPGMVRAGVYGGMSWEF